MVLPDWNAMSAEFREYAKSIGLSITGHGLLVLAVMIGVVVVPKQDPQPVQLAIEATMIDMRDIRRAEEQERRRRLQIERQQAAAEAKRRAEKERLLARERRKEEQRRREEAARAAERRRLEQERADREAKARKEEQRRREEAEKQRLERQRQQELARQKAEEEKRRKAIEAQMRQQLEEEERRLAAVESGLLARYLAIIRQKVARNWIPPSSAQPGVECEVHVTQIPGGDVVNVRVGRCNGDAAMVRSIEAAVFRASPLPLPEDPALFDRNLRFTFRPTEQE